MQWWVPRTLAFSIHKLSVILWDQLTAAGLVPVFNSFFFKDLSDIRLGILKPVCAFLKCFHIDKSREYLCSLQEVWVTDDGRTWCFCVELAKELIYFGNCIVPKAFIFIYISLFWTCVQSFFCSLGFLQVGRQSVQEALHDDTPNLQSRSRRWAGRKCWQVSEMVWSASLCLCLPGEKGLDTPTHGLVIPSAQSLSLGGMEVTIHLLMRSHAPRG